MRKTRVIKIDPDKCSGCRLCEAICSAFHAGPKYGAVNPSRSRIRVFRDEENNLYFPIITGAYSAVQCPSRCSIVIKGKEYGQRSFCAALCLSQDLFKELDFDISVKCGAYGEPPPREPLCVKWCLSDALTYFEREEED